MNLGVLKSTFSTSTGAGAVFGIEASRFFSAQASGATATVAIQGSLDATNWVDIVAASTMADGDIITNSTATASGFLVDHIRAVVSANGSTAGFNVFLAAD